MNITSILILMGIMLIVEIGLYTSRYKKPKLQISTLREETAKERELREIIDRMRFHQP